jgi:hypothetical protein
MNYIEEKIEKFCGISFRNQFLVRTSLWFESLCTLKFICGNTPKGMVLGAVEVITLGR